MKELFQKVIVSLVNQSPLTGKEIGREYNTRRFGTEITIYVTPEESSALRKLLPAVEHLGIHYFSSPFIHLWYPGSKTAADEFNTSMLNYVFSERKTVRKINVN